MDTQNNFKKNIWMSMCASFLMAVCVLLLVLPSFKSYRFLPHHLKLEKPSLLATVLIANYMFVFMFLVFLISFLFISLIFRKQLRVFQTYIICLMNKKKASIYIKVLAILLIVSCGVAILSYLWENRKTSISYKDVVSTTTKDINVILIIIDALRADHLGYYGYEKQTSPTIDSLANEGVLFRHCYTQASWTRSSVASILTSLYPTMHQAALTKQVLSERLTTLAEILREKGYVTYGCVATPGLKAKFNLDQGFDFFDDYLVRDKLYHLGLRYLKHIAPEFIGSVIIKWFKNRYNIKLANKRIISWLSKYRHENFFMYIHYMDPHPPYSPPAPYNRMYPYPAGDKNSKNISLYDGEIRFVDDHLGNFFERLKSWGIYDKTLIIITSDHGQAFGEHNNYTHGNTIYQDQLKVPLIIKFNPSMPRGKIIESQVRSIDIMPTILDILGVSYAGSLEGKSLLPLIRGEEGLEFCNDIFVEEDYKDYLFRGIIRNNEWKLIWTGEKSTLRKRKKSALMDIKRQGHIELYNLKEDPNELHNLATLEPEVLKSMLDKLTFFITDCQKKAVTPVETELDRETIEQLRSLGYLQ